MNTVDKLLSRSKMVSGTIALLCLLGVLVVTLCALVVADRQLDSMTAYAIGQDAVIDAQEALLDAYREQQETLASLLGHAANALQSIAYGPYTRAEVQDLVAEIAVVIQEVNEILTQEQAEEMSQTIVSNALVADLDPWLLLSVAITESRCRPLARGGSGEYGMLQVMPGTGAWIAGRLGYQDYHPTQLLDIRANVQFAAYYLRISIREFGGDVPKGLLAYNRGGHGARKWLQDSAPGGHRYVRKVLASYQQVKLRGVRG